MVQPHYRRCLVLFFLGVVAGSPCCFSTVARACPLCGPGIKTIADEIAESDAVIVGRLVSSEPLKGTAGQRSDAVRGTFKILMTLKGVSRLKGSSTVSVVYFSQLPADSQVLLMGVGRPLEWASPLKISNRAGEYLTRLVELPKEGVERFGYFLPYLEDEDPVLARDAYYEFVKAPYATIRQLSERLPREKLVRWIQSSELQEHRRLYCMMLGLCGKPDDLPMLESLLKASSGKPNAGMDSLVACYLSIRGGEGLPFIEGLFFKPARPQYPDVYATIMAIRFHLTEGDVIAKPRLVQSLREVLALPEMADLVVPELTKAQDWSALERLVELFKDADETKSEKSSWVRVPVINYLRACPLPKAKEYLAELERLDPDSVSKANIFFPVPPP